MFDFYDVKYKNILDLPSLSIGQERVTSLVGPSGSGKSTILKLLNKMISPTQGKIMFNGSDLNEIDAVLHRKNVGMLSQNSVIFDGTIRDNLNAGLMFQKRESLNDEALHQILEEVKLIKPLDIIAGKLSGGEKQRIALGRLLVLKPLIYLLDEPSSALDSEMEENIIQMLINHVNKEKKKIIMATHSKAIAKKYSDTIIAIAQGRLADGRESNE